MNQCLRCGISGEKAELFDTISSKGIIKLCRDCAFIEGFPIIKKPTEKQFSESEKQKSIRDRLIGMNKKFGKEVQLRDLIDQKFKKTVQLPSDLTDNFHWTIQRIRRNRKITREQFAKGIGESEATVRMVESGFLPESNYKIISKIEGYLGMSLRKAGSSGFPNTDEKRFVLDNSLVEKEKRELAFDRESIRELKVGDLKEMDEKVDKKQKGLSFFFNKKRQEEKKQEKSDEEKSKSVESWEEEYPQDDERFLDNPEGGYEEEENYKQ